MNTQVIAQPAIDTPDQREPELQDFVGRLLEEAKKQGAEAAEVGVSDDVGIGVTARNGDVETVEFAQDRAFGVTVYCGTQRGMAVTSDTSDRAVPETIEKALSICRHTQPDPCVGLAENDQMATAFPDLDLFHPSTQDVDSIKDQALAADEASLRNDERLIPSEGSTVSHSLSCRVYGNTHGFLQSVKSTRYSVQAQAVAKDDSGMQQDYWFDVARRKDDLDSPEAIGATAASRALARLQPRTIKTATYPVLFDPLQAAGLLGSLLTGISGGPLYRKSSYLCDSLGTQATTTVLTLREVPQLRGALGSRNFDAEGVACREKTFVNEGIVESYCLDSYAARRLGMQTTGNAGGYGPIELDTEKTTSRALHEALGNGFVVTRTMGQGLNVLTGDFSIGAAGYWVENGERTFAVDNVTVAGKMPALMQGLLGFGSDVERRGIIRTGSMLIGSMTVAAG